MKGTVFLFGIYLDYVSKNTKLLNKYKTLVFRAVFQFIKIEYD